MTVLDFAPLLAPGLPPAAAKWNGLAKYSFVGGNNAPEAVPVEALSKAMSDVLVREGKLKPGQLSPEDIATNKYNANG